MDLKRIAGVVSAIMLFAGGGVWLAHAEDAHQETKDLAPVVRGLVEIQKIQAAEKEAAREARELERERQRRQRAVEIEQWCREGILQGPLCEERSP